MAEFLIRLFPGSRAGVESLNTQAARGLERAPRRSQFSLLLRHFLERFFNHESFSPDGDAKARLVLLAFTAALPGFTVALYLWPIYHPFIRGVHMPPYWLQVNHRFFFVMYSFAAMGIATVFQWDLFFPDLLDIFVLSTLPVPALRLFLARVAAITILLGGFLFDANLFGAVMLPISIEPKSMLRYIAGHGLAMIAAGVFSAATILALQGWLLTLLGARLFRRVSLWLQGCLIAVLLMLLLLFPVISQAAPVFLESRPEWAMRFPPFWFLGIYERLLEGPGSLAIYSRLAHRGWVALLVVLAASMLGYPFAYLRRVRQLMEGLNTRQSRSGLAQGMNRLLHAWVMRVPLRRAVVHFINQTLLRVQRYRIYLVLYGGVGVSVLLAGILRLRVSGANVSMTVSADGLRAGLAVVAFWTIAGLRIAFVSSGNQQGSWVFRAIHGRPPKAGPAMDQRLAAKHWVLGWSLLLTLATVFVFRFVAPAELRTGWALASQVVLAVGLCVLLCDVFFLDVMTTPFTGEPARDQPSLALTMLKYFAFIPAVTWVALYGEPWLEEGVGHLVMGAAAVVAVDWVLRRWHRGKVEEHANLPGLEEGEDDFPMKLGLRS